MCEDARICNAIDERGVLGISLDRLWWPTLVVTRLVRGEMSPLSKYWQGKKKEFKGKGKGVIE